MNKYDLELKELNKKISNVRVLCRELQEKIKPLQGGLNDLRSEHKRLVARRSAITGFREMHNV